MERAQAHHLTVGIRCGVDHVLEAKDQARLCSPRNRTLASVNDDDVRCKGLHVVPPRSNLV
eukprot:2634305-Rhodomonas_salina.3